MSSTQLASAFFLAAALILLCCGIVARLVRRAKQPVVVGEMIAGILLGPSVLGLVAPGVQEAVFPPPLRTVLYVVGQIGLVAYMFRAGFELRTGRSGGVGRVAATTSAAGIAVPLALGVAVTLLAPAGLGLFPPGVPVWVGALFVGVALSITAFPMLARIIDERGLGHTRLGSLAMAAGAIDDVMAWILLAGVLSLAAGSGGPVVRAVGGAAGLVLVLVLLVRARARLTALAERAGHARILSVLVVVLFAVAWYTDVVGLYAVFGAFVLGVACPRTEPFERAARALDPIAAAFVPLFFVYSGLNTDAALLGRGSLLVFTAACVVLAIVAKLGACWAGARLAGESNETALRLGTLMNARGLMQLIAINVGLSAGIVAPPLFTVLVTVAVVTTVMTAPLLALLDRFPARSRPGHREIVEVDPAASRTAADATGPV